VPWRGVRGHDRIVAELRGALSGGRLPHAFLFVGPSGVGKHTVARALAQALLCERHDGSAPDPCGACAACKQVEAHTHPDLIEINRPPDRHELPIQTIRDLVHDLALKPMRGGRRVAIVDDADDLSEEAANAFLKTLEEPPSGSVLILVGTTPEAQLDTILSRCRVVRFGPLADEDVAAILMDKGAAEDVESALALARHGEGSVRRALGLAGTDLERFRRKLVDALAAPRPFDPSEMAQEIEAFAREAGKDSAAHRERASVIVGELARFFRGVLHEAAGLSAPSPDAADRRAAAALARRLEPDDVFLLAERCLDADVQIRRRAYLPLILEALTSDLCRLIHERRGTPGG
jgi:DNA polymerase-3 subunit delta'